MIVGPRLLATAGKGIVRIKFEYREIGSIVVFYVQRGIVADQFSAKADNIENGNNPQRDVG